MNKREKEVIQAQLDSEKSVLEQIEKQYQAALNQVNQEIKLLQADELTQSKVYQLEYQKALKGQISGILEKLHGDEYSTIQQYLTNSYTDGFIGAMYDIAGQGIPLIMPIDQTAVVRAVVLDSKVVKGYYDALGVDINKLKKTINAEVSRGIATGMPYSDIARNINNASRSGLYNAQRIARTEGHRIQQASAYDAQKAAKKKGADVVKQWDAVLDGATRPTHRKLDGQIKEIDEPFEADGKKAMYPGEFGDPAEDCNCRCVSLPRARWALDEDELKTLQERAEYFGLDKSKDFEEYKDKYLASSEQLELSQSGGAASPPKEYDGVFDDFAELNLSNEESKALSTLWEASNSSGFEHGIVIENGVASKPITSGLPDAVKISLDGYGSGLTVLHSHTNATPPSAQDFTRLLSENVDKIGVVGYNGDAYMAYIGSGETPSLKEFNDMVGDLGKEVNIDLFNHPNFFEWSVEERNYMAIREQAYRIAQTYGWTLEGGSIDVK